MVYLAIFKVACQPLFYTPAEVDVSLDIFENL